MSLTVPTSRADPGRAAQPAAVEPNGVAAGLSAFGQTMFEVGTALETDRLDREMQRLQVDMTRDLNELRLQNEQIGDPDQAEAAWGNGVAALKSRYQAQDETGRARVDPKNADRFSVAFDDLANRHAFSVGASALDLRNSQRQANYLAYTHAAAGAYATGGEEVREGTLSDLDAMIDADVAAGRIDAAEGQRRKQSFRAEGDNARAIAQISADPQGFLDARRAGDFDGLPPDTLARYDAQAETTLAARDKAAMTAAEKEAKARQTAIGDRLGEIRAIAGDGAEAVDESFLNTPEVKAHPDYAQTAAALSLRDEGKLLGSMSRADLRKALTAEEGRKVAHKWQTERRALLREALDAHDEGYSRDHVGYAQDMGREVPAWLGFDPAKPDTLALSLRERSRWAEDERALGYGTPASLMSDAERAELKKAAAPSNDPDTRLALARELVRGRGAEASAEASAISGDPVFDWATELLHQGAPHDTVRAILDGQSKMADKTAITPSRAEAITQFHEITGGEFRGQNALSERLLNSALAIYAGQMPAQEAGDIDGTAFTAAINRALGARADRGGQLSIGGLQTFDTRGSWGGDNYTIPLPVGVARGDVDHALDAVADDLSQPWRSDDPTYRGGPTTGGRAPVNLTRISAASPAGQTPDLGDPEADGYDPATLWSNMRLDAYWPDGRPADTYLLYRDIRGQRRYLLDTDGKPFVVSLKRLREATR